MTPSDQKITSILLIEEEAADGAGRSGLLRAQLALILPKAKVVVATPSTIAEGEIPPSDATLIEAGAAPLATVDLLRVLRARGFGGPIVVVRSAPDDAPLEATMASLGIAGVARSHVEQGPAELAATLASAVAADADVIAELRQARRIFAAGQAVLSLQHGINNPLAALMAEAQLLQMEQLTSEQRGSVDRMVELCRRIVVLVRRLDALSGAGTQTGVGAGPV
jgi:signal transduction histidine kinase